MNKLIYLILSLGVITASAMETPHKYQRQHVSVQTALLLAQNSYLLACTKLNKQLKPNKFHYSRCVKLAQNYVKNTLEYIVDQ